MRQIDRLITLPRLAYWAGRTLRKQFGNLVRFAVVLCCLLPLTPAPARLMPYPPQTVDTKHPLVCVHTRLTDEVEDLKVQRSLQMVREMGAGAIVDFFPWAYIEVAPDYYDWAGADRIVNMARQEGLQLIARLGFVPDWILPKVQGKSFTNNYLPPEHFADYARFVGKFVEHFKGRVERIIVWNEPNISLEWSFRPTTVAEYVSMVRLVYKAAHDANPAIVVMAGALAPTLEPVGSPSGLNDIEYLREMYAAGAAPYFDALAVHTYGFTLPADDPPAPDKLNFRRFELLYAVMKQNSDAAKPIYITESGWNDDPRWTQAVYPGQRVQYTLDSFRMVEQNWPTVKTVCIWYFRLPLPTLKYPDYYAFVTTEFRPRPIYDAVQAYARGLNEP